MKIRKILKKVVSILLIGTCILSITACGSATSTTSSENKPIKIGFSPLPTYYFWYLVEGKGFFKKHHVNVKLVYFPVYSDAASALNAGKIDGNSQVLLDSISPLSKGVPLKSVFGIDYSVGGDGIVAKPGIKSVKDLKGKNVATEIGTVEHFFLITALKDAGLSEKDVHLSNMSIEDAGNAFIAKKLDAAALWEPFLSKAQSKGKGTKIVSSTKYPGMIADLFVMNSKVMKERPTDVKNIVAAWFDAVEFYKKHPKESLKYIADKAGISVDELKLGLDGFKLLSKSDNKEIYQKGDSFQSLYYTSEQNGKFLKEIGFVKKIPDLNEFLDNRYTK